MRILVAVATRHGATQGIADSIGEVLREHGLDCTVARVEDIASVSEYDAIVLGSGIYAGHWLKSAREFAKAHSEELAARPTWLFSSGPIESAESVGALESGPVTDARLLAERIGARGEQTFAGRLELDELGRSERMVARIVRSPEGDFRDWDAIRAWAGQIAEDLTGSQMGAV
ncbi:MAG: flavodoxin domain-containing protein [Actinomycetota bacterium]